MHRARNWIVECSWWYHLQQNKIVGSWWSTIWFPIRCNQSYCSSKLLNLLFSKKYFRNSIYKQVSVQVLFSKTWNISNFLSSCVHNIRRHSCDRKYLVQYTSLTIPLLELKSFIYFFVAIVKNLVVIMHSTLLRTPPLCTYIV